MNRIKQNLVKKAKETYTNIYPCGTKETISQCFTAADNGKKLVFWFNTEDNNTHVMVEKMQA